MLYQLLIYESFPFLCLSLPLSLFLFLLDKEAKLDTSTPSFFILIVRVFLALCVLKTWYGYKDLDYKFIVDWFESYLHVQFYSTENIVGISYLWPQTYIFPSSLLY